MTSFVWSTFGPDGACCVESVRAVLELGVDPERCLVSVQRGRPLEAKHAEALEGEMGVRVEEGRYTRGDTYFDAVAKFRTLTRAGEDWVWHLDSDVILNDLSSIDELISGGYLAGAAAWPGCEFSGCSSIVHHDAAAACLRDMLSRNTAKLPHEGMPDDVMMGRVLDEVCGSRSVLRWPALVLGWYRFQRNWSELHSCRWIHFGQKRLARAHARGRPVRDAIAAHMREYREWRRTTLHGSAGEGSR